MSKERDKVKKERKSVIDTKPPAAKSPEKRIVRKKRKSKSERQMAFEEEEKKKKALDGKKKKKNLKDQKSRNRKVRIKGWSRGLWSKIGASIIRIKSRIVYLCENSLSILTGLSLLGVLGTTIWHLQFPERWPIVLAGVAVLGMLGAINHFIDK